MNINYEDCFKILAALQAIKAPAFSELKDLENKQKYIPSVKFMYGVSRNIEKLERITERLKKTMDPTDDFKKYQELREGLNKRFAKKDENGQPLTEQFVMSGNQVMQRYIIPGIDDEKSDYTKAFKKLKEEHKEAIGSMEEKEKSYMAMLQEPAKDFDPFYIGFDEVPEGLSELAWKGLIFIVKVDDEQGPKDEEPKKR